MTSPDEGTRTMREWVLGLPGQLADALVACGPAGWPPAGAPRRSVLICGMGGSAMAGDATRAILLDRLEVPLEVVRDPAVPAWVGPQTLVLAVSYSGNTWETIAAARTAAARGARVLVVTSGGTLAEEAGGKGWPVFRVPPGYAPRAALGWMAAAVTLGALSGDPCPQIPDEVRSDLSEAARVLAEEAEVWRAGHALAGRDVAEIAAAVEGRFAFVYAPTERMGPAALRWRGQLQENAKQAACAAVFPELAHNEITAWEFAVARLPSVHVLLGDDAAAEGSRGAHFRAAAAELEASGARVVRIPGRGQGPAARLFSHVLLADAVSVEVARRRGIDPLPVEAIERVKRAATR
jgi:glucose/mannose-6-phosphate isomerase